MEHVLHLLVILFLAIVFAGVFCQYKQAFNGKHPWLLFLTVILMLPFYIILLYGANELFHSNTTSPTTQQVNNQIG